MKIHNRQGTFGKHDQDVSRAAVLLEYIIREEEGGFKIPSKKVVKASFMKEANFVKLYQMVGNFLANSASTRRKGPTARNYGRTNLQESSIPSLAIRLGNFVQDVFLLQIVIDLEAFS